MRAALLPTLLLLLGSCSPRQAEAGATAEPSACEQRLFEGSRFTLCSETGGRVELRTGSRSFAELGVRPEDIAFAMNAGMFDEAGRPIGLFVANGRETRAINLRRGPGNFHLLPNGVFLVRRDGRAQVVTSADYAQSPDIAFATQSGPMLVIDGNLHPSFDRDGQSRTFRNGVGIAPDGTPVFAISEEPVSFGKFARLFRDSVGARDALYFDGSVSSLWHPAGHRQDSHSPLGPVVLVFRKR